MKNVVNIITFSELEPHFLFPPSPPKKKNQNQQHTTMNVLPTFVTVFRFE